MNILMSLFVVIVTYVVLAILKWAVQRHNRLKLFERCGIPGPKPSFLDGNLNELKSEPSPNEIISKWLKEYGDVFGFFIGEVPHVIVKDLDMLKQIMIKDFHSFTNRAEMFLDVWPLNKTILFLTGKRWKEVRSILTPTFSSGKIKLMTGIIEKKVDITLEVVSKHADNNEMFDMYELVQGLTLDVIADCALAMKTQCQKNSQDMFLIAVRDFFRYAHNRAVDYAIMFPFIKAILNVITKFTRGGQMTSIIVENVQTAIDARRKNPDVKSLDILQMMLDHGEDPKSSSRLTDDEVIANAYVFLLAGYETTATALAFTFYLLIKHPEVQMRLQKEIDATGGAEDYATVQGLQYLDQVFDEALRFYPPVTGFVERRCERDYQIGSFTIPKDAIVQAPVWDIHHDPELWPDPWKFDPDRFSPENKSSNQKLAHLSFGIGPRTCIGERFAKLEAKLAIFRLLKKFTFETCEKTDDPLPLICPTVIINPKNGVYLRAKLRNVENNLS